MRSFACHPFSVSWWNEKIPDGVHILGVPAVWVGRIGKLLEFASALVIVLDLVGRSATAAWLGRLVALLEWPRNALIRLGPRMSAWERWASSVSDLFFWGWALLLFVWAAYNRWKQHIPQFGFYLDPRAILLPLGLSFALLPALYLKVAPRATGFLTRRIEKLRVEASDDPKRPFTLAAVIVLVVGFTLDFATS